MSSASIQIKLAGAVLGAALILIAVLASRNTSQTVPDKGEVQTRQDVPPCSGAPSHSAGTQHATTANGHAHSVILSWHAAAPASAAPAEAIQGYLVFRRTDPGIYDESNRISQTPVTGTSCIDTTVEPRKTYYYAVKSVSQSGIRSIPSAGIRVVVPSP